MRDAPEEKQWSGRRVGARGRGSGGDLLIAGGWGIKVGERERERERERVEGRSTAGGGGGGSGLSGRLAWVRLGSLDRHERIETLEAPDRLRKYVLEGRPTVFSQVTRDLIPNVNVHD